LSRKTGVCNKKRRRKIGEKNNIRKVVWKWLECGEEKEDAKKLQKLENKETENYMKQKRKESEVKRNVKEKRKEKERIKKKEKRTEVYNKKRKKEEENNIRRVV